MNVRFTRRADGDVIFHCERADGTSTWQRQQGTHAAFFIRHDLTHFAVESILGCDRGFYGLIASGWDITDTEGKGPRGPLPAAAIAVEHLVGFLDLERATGTPASASEWAEQARRVGVDLHCIADRPISDEELNGIRLYRSTLFSRWDALEPGEHFDLDFRETPRVS